ncbi:hypothetical protein A2U01_0071811, partial [Trifolium medium]|nr:hypothetical protein [Trifolium medium]
TSCICWQLRPAWGAPSQAQKELYFPGFLLPTAPSLGGPEPGVVHCSQG